MGGALEDTRYQDGKKKEQRMGQGLNALGSRGPSILENGTLSAKVMHGLRELEERCLDQVGVLADWRAGEGSKHTIPSNETQATLKFKVMFINLPASEDFPMWALLNQSTASFQSLDSYYKEWTQCSHLTSPPLGLPYTVRSPVMSAQVDVSRFLDNLGWERPGLNVLPYPDVLRPSPLPPLLVLSSV